MSRARHRRDHLEQGMTLLEIMVVLAVIGMMMLLAVMGVRMVSKSTLREDTMELAATLRGAAEMAAQSGVHHRVVFDLEKQVYWVEACPEEMKLSRSDKEVKVDAAVLDSVPKPQPNTPGDLTQEVSQADSPEQAAAQTAALAGIRIGGARCTIPTTPNGEPDGRGNKHALRSGKGIAIRRLDVAHLREAVSTGSASVNFFPLGYAEKAVIEVADKDGETFTIVVRGLTGRVEVRDTAVDAEEFMRRDAAGDREVER